MEVGTGPVVEEAVEDGTGPVIEKAVEDGTGPFEEEAVDLASGRWSTRVGTTGALAAFRWALSASGIRVLGVAEAAECWLHSTEAAKEAREPTRSGQTVAPTTAPVEETSDSFASGRGMCVQKGSPGR